MSLFTSLRISASGLTAERLRMDVISNNIANANSTRTPEGGPYQRQRVVFSAITARTFGESGSGVAAVAIDRDQRPGNVVHEPDHPDADEAGYVEYPNVDIATEMVDMISASRAYQANVVAMQSAKNMVIQALDIIKG
jgi:flagellar basal-body rod protein FlgC